MPKEPVLSIVPSIRPSITLKNVREASSHGFFRIFGKGGVGVPSWIGGAEEDHLEVTMSCSTDICLEQLVAW